MTVQERPIFNATGRDSTPPPGQKVIVFADKLRCFGYIDFEGDWHRESDGMLIKASSRTISKGKPRAQTDKDTVL